MGKRLNWEPWSAEKLARELPSLILEAEAKYKGAYRKEGNRVRVQGLIRHLQGLNLTEEDIRSGEGETDLYLLGQVFHQIAKSSTPGKVKETLRLYLLADELYRNCSDRCADKEKYRQAIADEVAGLNVDVDENLDISAEIAERPSEQGVVEEASGEAKGGDASGVSSETEAIVAAARRQDKRSSEEAVVARREEEEVNRYTEDTKESAKTVVGGSEKSEEGEWIAGERTRDGYMRGYVKWYDDDTTVGVVMWGGEAKETASMLCRNLVSKWGFAKLAPGEPLEFLLTEVEGRTRVKTARLPKHRLTGKVKDYDVFNREGVIESSDGSELPFGFNDILYGWDGGEVSWDSQKKRIRWTGDRKKVDIEPRRGYYTVYERGKDRDGNEKAIRIKLAVSRYPIERFAILGNLKSLLDKLAKLAQKESWEYKFNPPPKRSTWHLPILRNYLFYTYTKLEQEEKIIIADDGEAAAFNTGLVTPEFRQVYACFVVAKEASVVGINWRFTQFVKESAAWFWHRFQGRMPKPARYFKNPADVIFDPDKKINKSDEHIVDDHEDRFPDNMQGPEKRRMRIGLLHTAIEEAQLRAEGNYKIAIPQYYKETVQLLLPLYLKGRTKDGEDGSPLPDLALVIVPGEGSYFAPTALPLYDAYSNARLITRPDDDWLEP